MIIPAAPARSISPQRRGEKIETRGRNAVRPRKRTPPARQGPHRRRGWFPGSGGSERIDRLLVEQDLGHALDDLVDVLAAEFALLEGVVGLHRPLVVENNRDVRFL